MTKKLFVVLPMLLLLLCGCAKKRTVTPMLNNISFTAEISYEGSKFSCDSKISDGLLILSVTEPEKIKGLSLEISKDSIKTEFMGITYTPQINSLTQSAASQILYDVLTDAASNTANFNNENCIISGKINEYKYCFVFSPSGLPISLEIDAIGLNVNFRDVKIN